MKLFFSILFLTQLFSVQSQNGDKLLILYDYFGRSPLDSSEVILNEKYGFKIIKKSNSYSSKENKEHNSNYAKLQQLNGGCWSLRYLEDLEKLNISSRLIFNQFFYLDTNIIKVKLISEIDENDKFKFKRGFAFSCWSGLTVLDFEVVSVEKGKLTKKRIQITGYKNLKKFYRNRNNHEKIYELKIARIYHCNSDEQPKVYEIIKFF